MNPFKNPEVAAYVKDVEDELAMLRRAKAQLEEALQCFLNIVSDSHGVAGYHLNGAIAEWEEFEEVGIAEQLLGAGVRTVAAPQPADPEPCFCDRMYPDSNPDASCGDCPTMDYGALAAYRQGGGE